MSVIEIATVEAIDAALAEVRAELTAAMGAHDAMRGPHEGWAVIHEEEDELWDEVRQRHPNNDRLRSEARQVAAMAVRFMVDVTEPVR